VDTKNRTVKLIMEPTIIPLAESVFIKKGMLELYDYINKKRPELFDENANTNTIYDKNDTYLKYLDFYILITF
jgi:hypothetical protein